MSPEQAKGKPLDKRTDIWAFGCVLYEMLSGTRAFGGEDVSDTLANVLKSEPGWTALPALLPTPITRLLRRAWRTIVKAGDRTGARGAPAPFGRDTAALPPRKRRNSFDLSSERVSSARISVRLAHQPLHLRRQPRLRAEGRSK